MSTLPANPSNLQAVANSAKPGDVVLLASGIYENTWPGSFVLEIKGSGAPGLPVSFKPAPGAMPIFAVAENWSGIMIEPGANYITLDGLRLVGLARLITYEEALRASQEIRGGPRTSGNGISIRSAHHIVVRNCQVTDMPGGGIYALECDYLTIDRNIVAGCCMWSRYGQSGISIHKSQSIDARAGTKIRVRGNACHGNENRIPWEKTGKIQDGHGIIFDENETYQGPLHASGNVCFGNGGLGVHAYRSPTAVVTDNLGRWNDRSNVTA